VARDRYRRLEEALDARLGHVRVAVEAVYHRHNVAAILRTCDAMGVHHVHLVEGRIPPAKAPARGAERWLELHRHANPAEAVAELRGAGFDLWVADLSDDAVPPEEIPLDRPVCLWVGAELAGVSPVARAAATGGGDGADARPRPVAQRRRGDGDVPAPARGGRPTSGGRAVAARRAGRGVGGVARP
jgi:tRNA G18 (ribose-2'-O)-methylase SpoU